MDYLLAAPRAIQFLDWMQNLSLSDVLITIDIYLNYTAHKL